MVINVRGTSGSGKTTLVRGLMSLGEKVPLIGSTGTHKRPEAYQVVNISEKPDLFVIGSYENVCGGCDAISTQDEICRRVRLYAPQGNTVMEGLLMSHLFSRYRDLDRELNHTTSDRFQCGIKFVWAFLDTPLEVCLDRVKARRQARYDAKPTLTQKPFNPQNTIDKWHDCRSVYEKAINAGLDARWVPYQNALATVSSWL